MSLDALDSNLIPIHNCVQISLENDYFKEKLTEFFKANKILKAYVERLSKENAELKSKIKVVRKSDSSSQTANILETKVAEKCSNSSLKLVKTSDAKCSTCTARNSNRRNKQIQTDDRWSSAKQSSSLCSCKNIDKDIYNKQNKLFVLKLNYLSLKKSYVKLCEMQHNLLKKYEEEVNANAVKQDLINHMKIELDQFELKCKEQESQIENLSAKLENFLHLESQHKSLQLDLENFKMKCEKYKKSLKYFDDSFFNEIEALKNKYNESIKLNKYYEHLLFRSDRDNLILKHLDASNRKTKKSKVKFAADVDEARFDYEDTTINKWLDSKKADQSRLNNLTESLRLASDSSCNEEEYSFNIQDLIDNLK